MLDLFSGNILARGEDDYDVKDPEYRDKKRQEKQNKQASKKAKGKKARKPLVVDSEEDNEPTSKGTGNEMDVDLPPSDKVPANDHSMSANSEDDADGNGPQQSDLENSIGPSTDYEDHPPNTSDFDEVPDELPSPDPFVLNTPPRRTRTPGQYISNLW